MKVKGTFLKFDVPNKNNQIISKDCKINIPKILPILHNFRTSEPPIGYCTVNRTDEGLIFDGDVCSPWNDIIKEIDETGLHPGGSGGYYNRLKKDENGFIIEMDLRAVSYVYAPVRDDYTFEITDCEFVGTSLIPEERGE